MTVDELKDWMEDKFNTMKSNQARIEQCLKKLNDKVTSHDHWLWLIRGIGIVVLLILGFFGFKK